MAYIHSCQFCCPYAHSPQPSSGSSPSSFVQITDHFQQHIDYDCSDWFGQFQLFPEVPEIYWPNTSYIHQPIVEPENYSDMDYDSSSAATVPQASEETLANLQKLSQEYQPEVKVCLISHA